MKDFEWGERISADDDTIDRYLHEGLQPQTPSASDMEFAAEWLALYGVSDETDPALEPFANVIGFLLKTAANKRARAQLNQQKRAFAAYFNVPVSQVRVNK